MWWLYLAFWDIWPFHCWRGKVGNWRCNKKCVPEFTRWDFSVNQATGCSWAAQIVSMWFLSLGGLASSGTAGIWMLCLLRAWNACWSSVTRAVNYRVWLSFNISKIPGGVDVGCIGLYQQSLWLNAENNKCILSWLVISFLSQPFLACHASFS